MLNTKHILPFLLGTLLITTACQKIDDDILSNNSKDSTEQSTDSTSTSTSSSNQGNGAETNPDAKTVVTQEDGTQLLQVDDHVIVLADTVENQINALLVSLVEWNNIAYSADACIHTQVVTIAKNYQEGDLKGWRMPTKEEAKELYNIYKSDASTSYSNALTSLNTKIKALGGTPINAWQAKDEFPAYRYLCSATDTTYSFSLRSGSQTSKVGNKVKYNLRLVRDSIILNQ